MKLYYFPTKIRIFLKPIIEQNHRNYTTIQLIINFRDFPVAISVKHNLGRVSSKWTCSTHEQ